MRYIYNVHVERGWNRDAHNYKDIKIRRGEIFLCTPERGWIVDACVHNYKHMCTPERGWNVDDMCTPERGWNVDACAHNYKHMCTPERGWNVDVFAYNLYTTLLCHIGGWMDTT